MSMEEERMADGHGNNDRQVRETDGDIINRKRPC